VSTEDILLDVTDSVATITLNRPDNGNAVTREQRELMGTWLVRANEDPDIRCVVLAATGRFFCTGADLSQVNDDPDASEPPERRVGDSRRMMLSGAISTVNAIIDCAKPVVAAVQGTAAGIGAHLAFACDLVVASENAKFIEVFARRGLAADGLGTWMLPRLIGLQRAKELILLGEDLSAQRAHEIGLVTRVAPADEFESTVSALARQLADGPTMAHTVNKWLLNRSLDVDRRTIGEEEAWIVEVMQATSDQAEGVASFFERRPPNFRGF
jgi:2-(1,2-epoxy-1,2-dihydrophenyl)acetyl-CoA isomerase